MLDPVPWNIHTSLVLDDVGMERQRQDEKWGTANSGIPDGTGYGGSVQMSDEAKLLCQLKFEAGEGTWLDILYEEVREAFAESDRALLRAELVQVAAVAVKWIEDLDRRKREA